MDEGCGLKGAHSDSKGCNEKKKRVNTKTTHDFKFLSPSITTSFYLIVFIPCLCFKSFGSHLLKAVECAERAL